jgi:hypothetical protein
MYCGVPKNRAIFSAIRPKASWPNAPDCGSGVATNASAEESPDALERAAHELGDARRALLVLEIRAQELVELDHFPGGPATFQP